MFTASKSNILSGRRFFVLPVFFLLVSTCSSQSLPPEKISRIDQLIKSKMLSDRIPGLSLAIAVEGKLIWSKGYGVADLENNVPAKPATAYRSASVGKTITATAVMQLAERGKLDLDAPVWNYCKDYPRKEWVLTSRQLLSHTGGVRHYGGPNAEEELYSTKRYGSVAQSLEVFKNDPLEFEPGTRYLYSSYGYNVLGCVVEGASGLNFIDYLQRNIFRPSQMVNTRDDDPNAVINDRASGYVRNSTGVLRNSRFIDMSNRLPAGGYITTAVDLVLFASNLMNEKLLSGKTLQEMLMPQKTSQGRTVEYGLGWGLFPGEDWYGEKEAFHGGQSPMVSSVLYILPERRFAVAIMMNLEGVGRRTELAALIAKEVLDLRTKFESKL